jgi:hypothetical protein
MKSNTKTILLLLALISCTIWIGGCKKTANNSPIVGTWNEVKVYNYTDSVGVIQTDTAAFATAPYSTQTFTADGHYTGFSPPSYYVYGTYTFTDTTLTIYASSLYINPLLSPIIETVSALQSHSMTLTLADTVISSGHQVIVKHTFNYTR